MGRNSGHTLDGRTLLKKPKKIVRKERRDVRIP